MKYHSSDLRIAVFVVYHQSFVEYQMAILYKIPLCLYQLFQGVDVPLSSRLPLSLGLLLLHDTVTKWFS